MSPGTDAGRPELRLSRTPPLFLLPPEITVTCLSFLSVRDVLRFAQASRACARPCRDGSSATVLWKHLLQQLTWPSPAPSPAFPPPYDARVFRAVQELPRPTHGWLFGPSFTVDQYGDVALSIELHSDLQWAEQSIRVKQGCCFTTLDLPSQEEAITLTAWLKACSECNLACKCGERTCVNYFVDYEADGEWHFLAMVERQASSDWFMDGRFVYTFVNEGFLDKWREKGQFAIGRGTGTPSERCQQFDGCLAQVCLWDRPLAAEHVARLYAYGLPLPRPK